MAQVSHFRWLTFVDGYLHKIFLSGLIGGFMLADFVSRLLIPIAQQLIGIAIVKRAVNVSQVCLVSASRSLLFSPFGRSASEPRLEGSRKRFRGTEAD